MPRPVDPCQPRIAWTRGVSSGQSAPCRPHLNKPDQTLSCQRYQSTPHATKPRAPSLPCLPILASRTMPRRASRSGPGRIAVGLDNPRPPIPAASSHAVPIQPGRALPIMPSLPCLPRLSPLSRPSMPVLPCLCCLSSSCHACRTNPGDAVPIAAMPAFPIAALLAYPALASHAHHCRSGRVRTLPIRSLPAGPLRPLAADRALPAVPFPPTRSLRCLPHRTMTARVVPNVALPASPHRVSPLRVAPSMTRLPGRSIPWSPLPIRVTPCLPPAPRLPARLLSAPADRFHASPSSPPLTSPCRPFHANQPQTGQPHDDIPSQSSPCRPWRAVPPLSLPAFPRPASLGWPRQQHLSVPFLPSSCVASDSMPTIPVLASAASPLHSSRLHASRPRPRLKADRCRSNPAVPCTRHPLRTIQSMPAMRPRARTRLASDADSLPELSQHTMPASPRLAFPMQSRPCDTCRGQRLRAYQSSPALPRVLDPSMRCLASKRAPVVRRPDCV